MEGRTPANSFGIGAATLYWIHLLAAFMREWNQTGEHDQYSGTSHSVRFLRKAGVTQIPYLEARIHLWGEPGVVLLVAAAFALAGASAAFPWWLSLVGVCLWSKEALNHWYNIRQRKRRQDVYDDTEDTVEPPTSSNLASEPPKATRKAKIKRSRNADSAVNSTRERRFAEILRLLPPYDLADAERNYHALVKELHPDANSASAESTAATTELNEAIDFFRTNRRV